MTREPGLAAAIFSATDLAGVPLSEACLAETVLLSAAGLLVVAGPAAAVVWRAVRGSAGGVVTSAVVVARLAMVFDRPIDGAGVARRSSTMDRRSRTLAADGSCRLDGMGGCGAATLLVYCDDCCGEACRGVLRSMLCG